MWPFGKSTADRVRDALEENNATKGLPVTVDEQGGTVTFQGEVPTQQHKNLLELIAEGIKGVKAADTSAVTVTQAPQAQESGSRASETAPEAGTGFTSAPPPPPVAPSVVLGDEVTRQVDASARAKKVLRALEANGELKDDPIDVLQSGGGIVLRGAVDSQHEHNLAVQIAKGVEGVTMVDSSGLRVVEGAKEKAKESARSAAPKAPTNVPDEYYTVKAGDTLSEIAQRFYGDGTRESYMKIARANNISDPDLIHPGQRLQIPR